MSRDRVTKEVRVPRGVDAYAFCAEELRRVGGCWEGLGAVRVERDGTVVHLFAELVYDQGGDAK